MQFLLANPAWLWLLAFAAAPVLVHLFARSNPPKFAFSSTIFLRKILKKTARLRKPQDWLLLLLRTLAVLALLLVFLKPLLTSKNHSTGTETTIIYLVDRSASMTCETGGGSRFSRACAEVTELLSSNPPDRANVIWIDAEPDALFPQPGPNLSYLKESMKRAEVQEEAAALNTAFELALDQLEQVRGKRKLVIMSDFQASAWKNFQLQAPTGIDIVHVKLGEEDVENLAVYELFTTPSNPVIGQDVLIVCRLRNYSPTPRRTTLYLESGGGRQSQEAEIPAWGEAELNFNSRFGLAGAHPLSASIAEDSFPGDDHRHALVEVREALKLTSLLPENESVHGDAPIILNNLATAIDWLDHQQLSAKNLATLGKTDFLFVHAWDGSNIDQLRSLSAKGTTLLVQPSIGCALSDCQKLLGLPDLGDATALPVDQTISQRKPNSSPPGWKAGISRHLDEDDPIFSLFRSGEFGNPVEGSFRLRTRLPSEWNGSVKRLIDYQDGVPGILSTREHHRQSAPILLWNLPLAHELSTWSDQTPFVSFFGELLLNSRSANVDPGLELLPGSILSWSPGEGRSPESIILMNEQNEAQPTQIHRTPDGTLLTSETPARPGIYRWKTGDNVIFKQVVNFPPTESDLRLMDPAKIEHGEAVDTESLLRRAALGDGIPLWPWLLAATITLLLLESLVCMWKPRPKDSPSPLGPKNPSIDASYKR